MAKAIPLADLEGQSLDKKIKSYFDSREKSSALGLKLLDICIQRTASQSRDWDGLARFLSSASKTSQVGVVRKIIRAAFGNQLTWKPSAKHPAGGTFVIGWQGSFNLLENAPNYRIITDAVEKGMGWDHKALAKLLAEAMPTERKARVVSDEAKKKVVKHLAGYMKKLVDEGFESGDILAALQKQLAADAATRSAPVGMMVKTVVNGATVYGPNF